NKTVTYMVENLDNKIALFAGTHNEDSSYMLMDLLHQHNISHNDKRIWFGQLYGMSDNISYNLSNNNYNVAKYLPFGPVFDVVPYLIRRANENTSVAGQTNRELDLLDKELKLRRARLFCRHKKKPFQHLKGFLFYFYGNRLTLRFCIKFWRKQINSFFFKNF